MKKFLALALCAAMTLPLAACASAKADSDAPETEPADTEAFSMMTGGWSHSDSPEISDELCAVFEKAMAGMVGTDIVPVAYLGSQVVAGLNHCFLCQSTVTYPGAEPHYVLVYVYESLDGTAELMNIADLDIGALCEYGTVENDIAGGEDVQIANPYVDYETLDDAARDAGFELTAPETVEGWDGEKLVQVMDHRMLQLIFHDADDNRLFLRKEAGDADISGDYNHYGEVNIFSVNGCEVTFKGEGGMVSTAIWTSGGYSYAISADIPMSIDAMTALIAQVA